MINYSKPKPHPLCGHFIKINSKSEYSQMREIAVGCGFAVSDYNTNPLFYYRFDNDKAVVYIGESNLSGQEITLSELRELAELSKIKLPCEMEVWDNCDFPKKHQVIDFYKGKPITKGVIRENYHTWLSYCLPNHRAGEIKAQIKEHQEAIDKLNQELEGIK